MVQRNAFTFFAQGVGCALTGQANVPFLRGKLSIAARSRVLAGCGNPRSASNLSGINMIYGLKITPRGSSLYRIRSPFPLCERDSEQYRGKKSRCRLARMEVLMESNFIRARIISQFILQQRNQWHTMSLPADHRRFAPYNRVRLEKEEKQIPKSNYFPEDPRAPAARI
ncbi:hypothetical protein V1478_005491 [Vespula squamosa]|uniref:Uncharacterized protein n=1 Tax=Vespula squamosa TaxID=30214 RepID=A0ABD2BEB3_VESSQ